MWIIPPLENHANSARHDESKRSRTTPSISMRPTLATSMRLRVGTYNLLCPTYGVKWGEREACLDWRSKDEHGLSNWEQRWPALRRVIQAAPWDLLALEELEDSTRADVEAACDGLGLRLAWFPHAGRSDALGLADDPRALRAEESVHRNYPSDAPTATSGRVDFRHLATGQPACREGGGRGESFVHLDARPV